MKPKTRRTLSIILAISMVLTLFPVGAFAKEAANIDGVAFLAEDTTPAAIDISTMKVFANAKASTSTDGAIELSGQELEEPFAEEPNVYIGESEATTKAGIEALATSWTYKSNEDGAEAAAVTDDQDWTAPGTYEVTVTGSGDYTGTATGSYVVKATEPEEIGITSLVITVDDEEVALDPEFDAEIFDYEGLVAADAEEVTVIAEFAGGDVEIAEANSEKSKNGVYTATLDFDLEEDELTFDVVFTPDTAELEDDDEELVDEEEPADEEEGDGSATYTITLTREAPAQYIDNIELEGAMFVDEEGEEAEFDYEVTDYDATFEADADEILMTVTLAEDVADLDGILACDVDGEEVDIEDGEGVDLTGLLEDGTVVTVTYALDEEAEEPDATYTITFHETVEAGITDIELTGATWKDDALVIFDEEAIAVIYEATLDEDNEDGIVDMAVTYAGGEIEVTIDEEAIDPESSDEGIDVFNITVTEDTDVLVEFTPEDGDEVTESYIIHICTAIINNEDGDIDVTVNPDVLDDVAAVDVPEDLADEIDENTKSISIVAISEEAEDADTFLINFPQALLDALADVADLLPDDFVLTIVTNLGTIEIPKDAIAAFADGTGVVQLSTDPELAEEEGIEDAVPENAIILTIDLGADIEDQINPPIGITLFDITFDNPIPFWFHGGLFRRLGHEFDAPVFTFFSTHCSDFVIMDEEDIDEIKDSVDQSMVLDELDSQDERYLSGADNWIASGYEYYNGNEFTKMVQTDDVSDGEEAGKTYYNIGKVSDAEDVVIAPEGMEVTYYEFDGKIFDGIFVNENNIVAKESTASER